MISTRITFNNDGISGVIPDKVHTEVSKINGMFFM